MTSEIRANTLKNRVGLGTVSFTNTGPVISGVTTIASGGKLSIGGVVPTELLHIADAGNPYILIEDTDANNQVGIKFKTTNYDWIAGLHGGIDSFKISQYTAFGTNDHFTINGAGNVFIEKDLDVDGHTNLDNVSIAGVTTTTENIHIKADNKQLKIGAHNDGDALLYHDGNKSVLVNYTGDFHIRSNNGSRSSNEGIILKPNGATEIYHSGNKKLETASTGANVIGNLDVINGHVFINDSYEL
ncbi:MAG: hypothetical protein VXY93_12470, partial [Pseudomonadota bacterium]|nr:hypothetical protein [Pseudomonadota bacterium]